MNAPLLFLGHAADRTGPPIYLRHLLRWIRAHHPDVDFEIALLAGGDLEGDFRDLAPTSIFGGVSPEPWDHDERLTLEQNPGSEDQLWAQRRRRRLQEQMRQHSGCRVVHINAAPSAELAAALPPGDRVLLSHVHELEIGLTYRCSESERALFLGGAQHLFAASEAVRANLIDRHGVAPVLISHHTEMVDLDEVGAVDLTPAEAGEARRTRGLPADGLVVGAAGTLDWRKAADIFLRIAWRLSRASRSVPLTFVWVGGVGDSVERARREARELGVERWVRFVGVQPDPIDWFRLVDVFVLPSREDPYPLVCLEAAAVGVPIVAFDNGGMPELLERGCGLVASYPDVEEFADRVEDLLRDPVRRRHMGERGRELIRLEHDVSVAAPKLWAEIERWLP